jgi:hypothetical protein
MLARPRFVRWRSLHSGSLHITSLFSGVSCWHDDAPGLSRCSDASGCPGPLLAYRFAECSSLSMRQTQTLGDSLARRTWGSDSPLMRLVTFAPRCGARSGRCGRGTRHPCFVRFRGWTSIPTLTTLRAALLPPSRGTGSPDDAPAYGSNERVRAGRQSDGYRTPQRTVACFVGRVLPKRSRTKSKPKGRVMVTRRGYGTASGPVALCAWAGLA